MRCSETIRAGSSCQSLDGGPGADPSGEERMLITEHLEQSVLVLTLEGRLDGSTAPAFKERIKTLVSAGQARLVVDLAKLQFLDSSGLGVLVSALRLAGQSNGDVKIAKLTLELKALFALTRLNKVFDIHESVESAVAAF